MRASDVVHAALSWARGAGRSRSLALLAKLDEVQVVFDESVSTAAIRKRAGVLELALAPSFCEEHVRNEHDAAFLLLHELMHHTKGHLAPLDLPVSLANRPRMVNLLMDVHVNRAVERQGMAAGCDLQRRLYEPEALPAGLLLPLQALLEHCAKKDPGATPLLDLQPQALHTSLARRSSLHARAERVLAAHFDVLGQGRPRTLARLYLEATTMDVEATSWLCRMADALELDEVRIAQVRLLGNHGSVKAGATRRPHEGFPPPLWNGENEDPETLDLSHLEARPKSAEEDVLRAFDQAVARAVEQTQSPTSESEVARTPLPCCGRRDLWQLSQGLMPPVWHPGTQGVGEEDRVRLYADASGSMFQLMGLIQHLVGRLGDQLSFPLWSWSGLVRPMSPQQLHAGDFPSDGITRILPVVSHASSFRRALVITDGQFDVPNEAIRIVHGSGVQLVFLIFGDRHSPKLDRLASSILFVPTILF